MKEVFETINRNISLSLNGLIEGLNPWIQVLILILVSLLVLFLFFSVSNSITRNKQWFYRLTGETQLLADLLAQSLAIFIRVTAIVITLYILGAESIVGLIIGTAGVFGLAISFAFKDIIENYIAGIILSIRQPFRKGDHILVADHEGIVLRMTTRMTMIKSFDGNNVSIPNATIFKSVIINFSIIPERRFEFKIGINPDADPNFARKIGLKVLTDLNDVLDTPPPLAHIESIGDSSIVLVFYGWVDQDKSDFYQVRSLAVGAVKESIEDHGIEIPDPSYIIKIKNIEQEPSSTSSTLNLENSELKNIESLMSTQTNEIDFVRKQAKQELNKPDLLNKETIE